MDINQQFLEARRRYEQIRTQYQHASSPPGSRERTEIERADQVVRGSVGPQLCRRHDRSHSRYVVLGVRRFAAFKEYVVVMMPWGGRNQGKIQHFPLLGPGGFLKPVRTERYQGPRFIRIRPLGEEEARSLFYVDPDMTCLYL